MIITRILAAFKLFKKQVQIPIREYKYHACRYPNLFCARFFVTNPSVKGEENKSRKSATRPPSWKFQVSSSIEERKEERGGNTKTKEDNGTEAHERLRIFRGRAQLSKGVSNPALDLYPTPSYRVKKGKGNEIEMKNM
ncbi:hypothetical protein P5673_018890 [Acropora cervicornis]|uniref:Uncharacterized protein n=1 Tax=Acropora cervicornis TaxID=6130 RepID=A0AAD9QC65_ACRCE|nr:hypothetical protein P5673_018890 [Acropora cervicornis]